VSFSGENKVGIGMTSDRTRRRMVDRLRQEGISDEAVLQALSVVPRHLFVEEALASRAYDDVSLPIGFGQTISRPLTVARSCELARAGSPLKRVLEIGTGCGYQAAVLSRIAKEVYSIERIGTLLSGARIRLRSLKYHNVRVKHGDGSEALDSLFPLDAIVIAAGSSALPEHLIKLLVPQGRLIIPLGSTKQYLTEVIKLESGYEVKKHEEVSFVPFLSGVVVK
jgi:protein-L-isoaspartate(D-aspartate) O-methyltransferase